MIIQLVLEVQKYLRHPLSSQFQGQFIFTVGEIQLEINKKTFN